MPTKQEFERMIVKAHRAGDLASAKRLAQMAKGAEPAPKTMQDALRSGTKKYLVGPDHPGLFPTLQDFAGFGWGNEAISAIGGAMDAVTGQGSYRQGYDRRLQEAEQLKADFRKEQPGKAIGATMLPAFATGTAAARLLNPKTVKQAIGLGAAEGAVTGTGEAQPGAENRLKGGAVGGGLGGAASLGIPLVGGLLKGVPKAVRGLNRFGGKPAEGVESAEDTAMKFLANMYQRLGLTPEEALAKAKKSYSTTDTLADATPEQSEFLLPGVAAYSDETADIARKSGIATRMEDDTLLSRVQSRTGMDDKGLQRVSSYEDYIGGKKKEAGKAIDARIDATGGIEVDDQGLIDDFLSLKAAKGLKREVNESLELRKRGPHYADEGEELADEFAEEAVDGNRQLYDEAFLQETSARLNKRISQMREEGIDTADAKELKTQWDELMESILGKDSQLINLRNKYGVVAKRERAFKQGLELKDKAGKPLNHRTLKKHLGTLDKKNRDAFTKGAVAYYAEKGDKLLGLLGSPSERKKISAIFGSDAGKSAKTISNTEKTYATVSEKLAAGTSAQGRKVAQDTLQGDLEGIETLFKRLEGKRAYSGIGAVGLFINEVVGIMQKTEISNEAANAIMRNISASGDQINAILTRIGKIEMPALAREKIVKEEMKKLARAKTSGYGAMAGSLSSSILGTDY